MSRDTDNTNPPVLTAVVVGAMCSAQLVASQALRDGYFLTHFEVSDLPKMIMASALFSLVFILTSTHLLRRVAPAKSMPWFFCASAILFTLESVLATSLPLVAAVLLYLHVLSLGLLVASGYWSVLSERFDPYSAKRFIGRIGSGATLGGALGGAVIWWASTFAVHWMLLSLAVMNFACAVGVWQLGSGSTHRVHATATDQSAFSILAKTPYLRHLAWLMALGAFCQASYDFVLKATVADNYSSGAELVSFFALFYMSLNVCTFLFQNLLTRYTLEKYGLSTTVGSLSGAGVGLGFLALVFPGLTSIIMTRGGVGVVENSMFRSGYELLYTPVLPDKKRPTKPIIDVGGDMLGMTMAGGLIFIILAVVPDIASTLLVFAGIGASLAGLLVTRRIRQGYIKSLADSLEADNIDIETAVFGEDLQLLPASIVTALQTQAGTTSSRSRSMQRPAYRLNRAELVAEMQSRQPRAHKARDSPTPGQNHQPYKAPVLETSGNGLDEISAAILTLRGADAEQINRVLVMHNPLPAELITHVIALLDDSSQADQAAKALRLVAPRHLGALLDAALLPGTSLAVKRQICEILEQVPTQRCANGLLEMLTEDDLELRLRAAGSLLGMHRSNPALNIPQQRVFDAATTEAVICSQIWRARRAVDGRVSATPPLESTQGQRVIQGITYISALLLTVLDPQPTGLAIRSLANRSMAHRGTGLEYLQNVLPGPLLKAMLPLLEDRELALGSVRPRAGILAELTSSRDSDADMIPALRKRVDELRSNRRNKR